MGGGAEVGEKNHKTQKERSNNMRQEKKTGHGTRRAIASSVLAIVLCLVMLVGSTFAWFTDTASTGVNKIVSGNLDVGLEYWGVGEDGQKKWLTAEDSKKLFDENALWEPGYTQIIYLKVKNNGNLALNYAMQITPVHETVGVNVNGDEFKLSDYIKFGWTTFTADANGAPVSSLDRVTARSAAGEGVKLGESLHRQVTQDQGDGTKVPVPLAAKAEELVALVAWMPENVGNVANYGTVQPTIELTLKVLATQAAVESDSFGSTYDKDAATDEDLDSKPEYDYESLYDYDNPEGYGVELVKEDGKVVKAIVSGVNGKVPDGFFANLKGSVDENGKPIAVPAERWADLTEVVIKDGVTEIGKDVFQGCVGLTNVTIPDSVKKIGTWSFYMCKGLKNVDIPANMEIGDSSFRQSGLEQVTVSGGSVGNYAFHRIDNLKKISINCETIGEEAFSGCDSLTDITLGSSVKTLGRAVFYTCKNLENVEIPSTVTDIGEKTFYSCPALKEAIIRAGTVKAGTFYNCGALTTLVISDNATLDASFTVGNTYAKEALETVKIGKGEISNSAFSNCTNLTTVELGDGVTSIGAGAFGKCGKLTSITIGSGVNAIGNSAFSNCTALEKAEIKGGTIGDAAFSNCTSLTSVTMGANVTAIGYNTFLNCKGLTTITVGSNVTSIGRFAFSGCTALEEVRIPAATTMGVRLFNGASALKKVTFGDTVTNIPAGVFSNCGMKANNGQLLLKVGTWASNNQTTTVAEGTSITANNPVFIQIMSGKAATWSAPVNP